MKKLFDFFKKKGHRASAVKTHEDDSGDDNIVEKMKKIRESVPESENGEVISKVISASEVDGYLSGLFCQVWGYVTRACDTAKCRKYMDYYLDLGLGYEGSPFDPQKDKYLGIIRFPIYAGDNFSGKLIIPYGTGFGGIFSDPLPFTGNGFAIGAGTDSIIPEYMLTSPVGIPGGAELYIVYQNGDEVLMGVFNGEKEKFIRLEDMD
ncbi:MAG: hypothetical protein K2N72_06080 [Oscillospiraceae bacterium]|nr:hypothetical protein [Oscillospiraceae bacterium]